MAFNFATLQDEVGRWSDQMFPDDHAYHKLLGVIEEAGELAQTEGDEHLSGLIIILGRLAHAQLKTENKIRVSQDHDRTAKDAIGEILIFLAGYCHKRGFQMQECAEETWNQIVAKRTRQDFIDAGK
jgi:NTP pyrophosphatase (non-canonical NTP hydrolase)